MMGVVEQQREAAAVPLRRPMRATRAGSVPFVHDHDVGAVERRFEVEMPRRRYCAADGEIGRETLPAGRSP